jgi:ABC-2 type transport system permease protein
MRHFLRSTWSTIHFVGGYLALNLAAAMEYRGAFISQVLGMALNDAMMIFFWWLFFRQFPTLGGWQLGDVLRLWAVVAVAYGLGTAIFGQSVQLATFILNGQLDYYLTLPRDVLLHTLISRMSPSAWGDVLFGFIAFGLAGDVGPAALGLFVVFAATGCAVFVAYHVLVASITFWLGSSEALSVQASSALINFSTYPGSIFRGWIKTVTFTLIPAAMLGHVPVSLLRHFDPASLAEVVAFSLAITGLAVLVFRAGLRRYESGSLVVLRG